MQVKLVDGTTVDVIQVNGSKIYYQNANRDSLEIVFSKAANDLTTIDTIFSNESNLTTLTIIQPSMETVVDETTGEPSEVETTTEHIYNDYVLKTSVRTERFVIKPGDSNTPDTTEERIFVTIAQQTYIEKLLSQMLGA